MQQMECFRVTRSMLADALAPCSALQAQVIKTVSPEGTFCDTVQVPSSAGDMELN